MNWDLVVVGGGVVGLGAARGLARSGASVCLIDPELNQASSLAAAGMLAPISEAKEVERELLKISQQSLRAWPEFASTLQTETGKDLDFRQHGTLNVALDPDHHRALLHIQKQHAALGLDTEMLDAEQTLKLEPGLSPRVFSSLYCPHEKQVNPRWLLDALRASCVSLGVEFVKARADSVAGNTVTADDVSFSAQTILIAGGAWSGRISGLKTPPDLRPIRGQMVQVASDTALLSRTVRTPDVYLVPRSDGSMVLGSTMEEVGFDLSQTFGGVMDIMRDAWETIPSLYDTTLLGTWSGLRPMAFRNFPIVECDPEQPNLFYATGHGRGGILLAPWTIEKITNLVTEFLNG